MSCSELLFFVLRDTLCSVRRSNTEASMFSKLSGALQAAAHMVAPPCTKIEDLKYHWQQLLHECRECQKSAIGSKLLTVAEETHAPRHLKEMYMIFAADAVEVPVSMTLSPCMEYVLQEQILVSLSSFAWADRPLGIRQYIYRFLSAVLHHLHHSHLHQMRVHKPLHVMVQATCEKRASPYENQEMEFLSILCERIKEDSSLILLYLEPCSLIGGASGSATPDLSGMSTPIPQQMTEDLSEMANTLPTSSKFPLMDALLNLCHSSDTKICSQAHGALLLITGLREPRSSGAMTNHTLLSHYIASRLIAAAELVPLDTEPTLLEDVETGEDDRYPEYDVEDCAEFLDFPGKKEATELLRWFLFADKLIGGCDCFLATNLCGIIRELFLEGFVCPFFMSDEEDDVADLFTSLLTKMLLLVRSVALSNSIISWLTEDAIGHHEGGGMRQFLLNRCSKGPHHLQIRSLRLLQVLIEKPGSMAVQVLALNFVSSRGYYDSSAAEYQQNSWSDEEDERYKQRDESEHTPFSRTLAPSNINIIVKRFLSLVPDEIQSTSHDDFDSYKADALKQYGHVCNRVPPYSSWPREAVMAEVLSDASSTTSKESKAEAESNDAFVEGPFLAMLLDFLEHLPEQDYDINLQVTSLISSLALLPHPHLHEYLLNPTIPLAGGVRTPFNVLSSVVSRIHPVIVTKKDFKNYLKVTRFQLLGTVEELDYERDEDDAKFETLIVIEEFCKELSAIAFAKYTCEGKL